MAELAHAQFIREFNSLGERRSRPYTPWVCIDERPIIAGEYLGDYLQLAGTVAGLGAYVGTAVHMAARRRHANAPGIVTSTYTHQLGAINAKVLEDKGVVIFTHHSCSAEANARQVREQVLGNQKVVQALAQRIDPDIDSARYAEVAEAYAALNIAEPDITTDELDYGTELWLPGKSDSTTLSAFARLDLEPMEHVAGDVLVDLQPGVAFDVAAALEAGHPAYHISLGDLSNLHGPLHDSSPDLGRIDWDDFRHATIVGHAATIGLLPTPKGEPLNVHVLPAV